ncbi:MAG: FxsA family protein [Pseudomonadota bacterium]
MWLFLLLLLVPLIEIGLFIEVGGWIGLWPTIAVVILTAVIGTALLRSQGLATLRELQSRLDRGDHPGSTLAHGALILVAGVVLLTPGFFTDAVGFLLLVPTFRSFLIAHLAKRVVVAGTVHMHRGGAAQGPRRDTQGNATIDGEYEPVGAADDTAGRDDSADRGSQGGQPPSRH